MISKEGDEVIVKERRVVEGVDGPDNGVIRGICGRINVVGGVGAGSVDEKERVVLSVDTSCNIGGAVDMCTGCVLGAIAGSWSSGSLWYGRSKG